MISKQKIQLLPEHLIDQIKAGEVVDGPASLLKELLENAIDANAKKINLKLVNAGIDMIRIEDDGDGMSFDDLPWAFARHATSKINKFEDLYALTSYGFRGEALASIAAIARVSCKSAPRNNLSSGGIIEFDDSKMIKHIPSSMDKNGTTILVESIFYNTPARLKFLKSKQSESGLINRLLYSFVYSYPEIRFEIEIDDEEKIVFDSINQVENPKAQRFRDMCECTSSDFIYTSNSYDNHTVNILFTKNAVKLKKQKLQLLFTNNRLFKDPVIHKITTDILSKVWGPLKTGSYIIEICAPANLIDVNVHPNKTKIKFANTATILSLLSATLNRETKKLPMAVDNENSSPSDHLTSFDLLDESRSEQKESCKSNIFGNFYISLENEKISIYRLEKLLSMYLYVEFKSFIPTENNTTPLMVSIPYTTNKKIDEVFIKNASCVGFEFDQFASGTIILRTIPLFLESLPYQKIVEILLKKYNFDKKEFFSLVAEDLQEIRHHISWESIVEQLKEKNSEELKKIEKTLTINDLERIMS